jgi:hypothetical protein
MAREHMLASGRVGLIRSTDLIATTPYSLSMKGTCLVGEGADEVDGVVDHALSLEGSHGTVHVLQAGHTKQPTTDRQRDTLEK